MKTASVAGISAPQNRARPGWAEGLLSGAASAGVGLLVVTAALLGWRRMDGAMTRPLDAAGLLIAAATLAAGAGLVRWALWFSRRQRPPHRPAIFGSAALSVAVVGVAVAMSLPGSPPLGLAALWLFVGVEELWGLRPATWKWWPGRGASAPVCAPSLRAEETQGVTGPAAWPEGSAAEPPAENVSQQLTRSRASDGTETLTGFLRVPLAAGQRNSSVHLAFCPPFGRTPRVSLQQLAGPEMRIKVAQVLPYGARCDLKLVGMSEAAAVVLLRFTAVADAEIPAPPPTPSPTSPAEIP